MFMYERRVAYPEGHRKRGSSRSAANSSTATAAQDRRKNAAGRPRRTRKMAISVYLKKSFNGHRGQPHQRDEHLGTRLAGTTIRISEGRVGGNLPRATGQNYEESRDAPAKTNSAKAIRSARLGVPRAFVDLALEKGYRMELPRPAPITFRRT